MIPTKKINDVIVKTYNGLDDRPYKYQDLFPNNAYFSAMVIGPSNGGKSVIVSNIILNCVSNRTVVRIYSSSMEADFTTTKTISKLEKRGIDVEKYD